MMRRTWQLLTVLLIFAPGFASAQNGERSAAAPPRTENLPYVTLPSPIAWIVNSGDPLSIMKKELLRMERAGLSTVPGATLPDKLALLRKYHVQGDKLATAGKALSWMNSVDVLVGMALRLGRGDTVRASGHGVNWIGSTLGAMGGIALVGGATVSAPAFLGAIAGSIAYDKLGKPLVDWATVQTKAYVDLTALSAILEEAEGFLKGQDWLRADIAARKVIDGYYLVNQSDPDVGATSQARDLHSRALDIRGEVARQRQAVAKPNPPATPPPSAPPKPAAIMLGGDGFWKWKTTKAEGPERKLKITIDVPKQSFFGEISGRETEQQTDGPEAKTFSGTFDGKFTGDATHGTLEGSGNCRTHRTGFTRRTISFVNPSGLTDFRPGPLEKFENTHQYTFQLKATLTDGLVTGSAWVIATDGKHEDKVTLHYVGTAIVK
jgi:hypothetical protein